MLAFREAGFTLLEILIAITLLAFITIGVVSVTDNAFETMDRTTEINKNNLNVETALARFEWDFSQIYSPLYFSTALNMSAADPYGATNDANSDGRDDTTGEEVKPGSQVSPELQEYYQRLNQRFEMSQQFKGISKEGLPIPRFISPEKNVFEFFTSSNRRKIENTKQSHFGWVRYALTDMNSRASDNDQISPNIPQGLKALVRYFSADNPYSDERMNPQDDKIKGAILLENVESMEFQFWNPNNRKWENNLNTIPSGESLLRGVRLLLSWYDSVGNKKSISRIYRNLWPLEVPQDFPPTQRPTTQSGTSSGTTAPLEGGEND